MMPMSAGSSDMLHPVAAVLGSGTMEGRNPYSWWQLNQAGIAGIGVPGAGIYPHPATYETYRLMLSHPTIALSWLVTIAPAITTRWSFETNQEIAPPDDAIECVKNAVDRIKHDLAKNLIRAVVYGFQAGELIWGKDAKGRTTPTRVKWLLPDFTTFDVDAKGELSALVNGNVRLAKGEFVLWSHDREGSNYFGRSRLENARRSWSNYLAAEDRLAMLETKTSGIIPKVGYPPDGRLPDGKMPDIEQSNYAKAIRVAQGMAAGKPVVYQNLGGMQVSTPEQLAALADKSMWSAETIDMGNTGPAQSALIERLRMLDANLCRAMLKPERSVIEASQSGSRADSESHGDINDFDTDQLNSEIASVVNEFIVDEILEQNYGPQFRGGVRVQPKEIVDEQRIVDKSLLQAILSGKSTMAEVFRRIDMDAFCERNGITIKADAEPWGESDGDLSGGEDEEQRMAKAIDDEQR
jgi:hypothetical protein